MEAEPLPDVLQLLGVRPVQVTTLKDLPFENGSWLLERGGAQPVVLRRYHHGATPEDVAYEHAVLGYLAASGWVVPAPTSDLVHHDGLLYCLTQFVPGAAVRGESPEQRRQRGQDLARLDLALRDLGDEIGQRPGWRTQHDHISVHESVEWEASLDEFAATDPRLAAWAARAADETRAALASIGAHDLPLTVVHGDFAEWNVHYLDGRLAGVVDFGLAHLDSRPYELAIARTYRAPEAIDAYAAELARCGWPLTALEHAAIEPVHRAFRIDMAAWELQQGRRTGRYDTVMIERQLSRTGVEPA